MARIFTFCFLHVCTDDSYRNQQNEVQFGHLHLRLTWTPLRGLPSYPPLLLEQTGYREYEDCIDFVFCLRKCPTGEHQPKNTCSANCNHVSSVIISSRYNILTIQSMSMLGQLTSTVLCSLPAVFVSGDTDFNTCLQTAVGAAMWHCSLFPLIISALY